MDSRDRIIAELRELVAKQAAQQVTTRIGYCGLAVLHSVGLANADWESPETASKYWADASLAIV